MDERDCAPKAARATPGTDPADYRTSKSAAAMQNTDSAGLGSAEMGEVEGAVARGVDVRWLPVPVGFEYGAAEYRLRAMNVQQGDVLDVRDHWGMWAPAEVVKKEGRRVYILCQ